MSTPREPPAIAPPGQLVARVPSVDVLRGLVMFVMLFVNDLAGAPNVPAWLKHFAPPLDNGITFVDLVFPAFLFVVGLSIPLAFASRRSKGESPLGTLAHILLRSGSLLLLGVVMVNFRGWGPWPLLALAACIAAFVHIGPLPRRVNMAVRLAGFLALAILIFSYPRFHPGQSFRPQWWGILGLIGWAYLVAALIYLATGPARAKLVAALALLIGVYYAAAQTAHADLASYLSLPGFALSDWIDIGPHLGSHSAITLAGVLLGTSLLRVSPEQSVAARCSFGLQLAGVLALGALLTYPSFGLNKTLATPAWSLLAASVTTLLFLPLHLLADTHTSHRPLTCSTDPLSPTSPSPRPHFVTLSLRHFVTCSCLLGSSALFAYLLQPLFFRLLSLVQFSYNDLAPNPLWAVTRAFLASILLSALAVALHTKQVRLKL